MKKLFIIAFLISSYGFASYHSPSWPWLYTSTEPEVANKLSINSYLNNDESILPKLFSSEDLKKIASDPQFRARSAGNLRTKIESKMLPVMFNFSGLPLESLEGLDKLPAIATQGIGPNKSKIDMNNLVSMSFDGSGLTDLDENNFSLYPSLQKLDLGNNKLSNFKPNAFNGLKNLENLYLYVNNITALAPRMFEKLTQLKKLGLSSNKITHLTDPSVFNGLTHLEILQFDKNPLIELNPAVITQFPKLRVLNLKETKLTSAQVQAIQDALAKAGRSVEIAYSYAQ